MLKYISMYLVRRNIFKMHLSLVIKTYFWHALSIECSTSLVHNSQFWYNLRWVLHVVYSYYINFVNPGPDLLFISSPNIDRSIARKKSSFNPSIAQITTWAAFVAESISSSFSEQIKKYRASQNIQMKKRDRQNRSQIPPANNGLDIRPKPRENKDYCSAERNLYIGN